jgi:hypothetical protein
VPTPVQPAIEATPAPPLTLVAYLRSNHGSRVSVRIGEELRVISPGQTIDGWTCVSIDRDEGAVFTSPRYGRVVLKTTAPDR